MEMEILHSILRINCLYILIIQLITGQICKINTILKLFQTGLTTSEISNIVEALNEKKYSRGNVSNITNQVIANVDKFKQRPIKSHYAVIYTDANYICLRRDSVAKEAVYIALGITPEGNKEILGYKIK